MSKPERPIDERAPRNFLFQLKTLLVQWGYTKKTVYVDEDLSTLNICGTCILSAGAKDGLLDLKWELKEFETWAEFQNNTEFLEIKQKCNDSLRAARDSKGKGVGKGSSKGLA